jgi:hypothetical protein
VSNNVVHILRRRDDTPHDLIERRRSPRLEPNEDTYVEDANGSTLGLVGDLSEGGFSVIPEHDAQARAFGVGKEMVLTLVGQKSRLKAHARVVYVTSFAIGLEFIERI